MTLPFLEKVIQVLLQGGFSSTYKYAVLLGLIDLCVEAGHPPTMLTTAQLARRVTELYWPQVRTYPPKQGVLGQNQGGQATIARLVAEFRQAHPDLMSPPREGPLAPTGYKMLLREVEWILIEYPLPRLQRVGGGEEQFLYEIPWGEDVSRAAFNQYKRDEEAAREPGSALVPREGVGFDNRILLKPGAAELLIALSSVVRPLVQHHWMVKVRAINRLKDAELDEFLFGRERISLSPLQRPLRAFQGGRCFYCHGSLSGGASQVDHFLPWSRYPDDGLDNLLLAHDTCNNDKLHFLADLDFGRRWLARNLEESARLNEIAADARWPRDRRRTFGVVASVYQGVPDGVRLWAGGGRLRRIEVSDLPDVHGFGRASLAARNVQEDRERETARI